MNMRPAGIQTRTGTTHLMRPPAVLLLTNHQQTHTLRQRTATGPRRTMLTKSTIQPTQHRTIIIMSLCGMDRMDTRRRSCSPPTTPDTEYNPETVNSLVSHLIKSKPGHTVKLPLA